MEYEIHITVENNDTFVKTCEEIGIKPIVIVVDEINQESNQVMTSSKHSGETWRDVMNNISNCLLSKDQKIIRQKVEILPGVKKSENHIYYESHIRLKLKKDYDKTALIHVCKYMKFHISRNLFKKNKDFDWLMITCRQYNTKLSLFKSLVSTMAGVLDNMDIEYDKIEVEECIFDSNENIDKEWLS